MSSLALALFILGVSKVFLIRPHVHENRHRAHFG